jgi:hypothetical protein
MKLALNTSDKSIVVLNQLNLASSDSEKISILEKFYEDAFANVVNGAEEIFKSKSRRIVATIITTWFFTFNISIVWLIREILIFEQQTGVLGKGIISTSVIITLIGASVVQNAAAFMIFAKYSFGVKNFINEIKNSNEKTESSS